MAHVVSHYRLEEEIGRGGMGVVYRATDTRLGRALAIKMLPADATADPDRNARFVREAQAASALNHPHIVTIYDIDATDGVTFIAMELVDGTPLDRLLAAGPLTVPQALEYGAQIAAALDAAHASGIVHRDIKPGNIMITHDGRVKVLDFGLAKLVERSPDEATKTALATRAGVILGTAAYMSPEQAEGRPVDRRSDIFSLGGVLYEMLAGRRPFAGRSDIGVITAILRDTPAPVQNARKDVPAAVGAIVDRCLVKDPALRYADAGALRGALEAALARLTRPVRAWRRPAVLVPVAVVLIGMTAVGAWQFVQARRTRWARDIVIPEIARVQEEHPARAMRLARDAEPYAPEDVARARNPWYRMRLETDPPGATVSLRDYVDREGAWYPLGETPLADPQVPFGFYRLRIAKAGFVPLEIGSNMLGRPRVVLIPESANVPGMVPVPAGRHDFGKTSVQLPAYWMGTREVSNREFKRFIDAGGYREPKYWKEPFRDGDRVLGFEDAMARFRDTTGRSGPATWELSSYPEGRDDFPVGAISWFEAAAFADFAGASLPSIYHWYRASGVNDIFSTILRLSNVDGTGPVRTGELQGVGPFGTTDMAGNVKEWCSNLVLGTSRRYILGGAWNEPGYRFVDADAQDPWQRQPTFGVRVVKNVGSADAAVVPVGMVNGDPKSVVPASDALFDVYRRFYAYDRSPLNPRVESVDESVPEYRKEKVSFDAAYGGERVPAYLFLPKHVKPPYQVVLFFPSGYAMAVPSSRYLDLRAFDFIVRSGRALLYPVYQGTFERRRDRPAGPSAARDRAVQQTKDLFRAVDYLETRPELDNSRLAYYSLSMGAYFGPIPVSLEPRIKVAVFAAGGLRFNAPPEIQPANFAPHVNVPVLLVNGREDFSNSLEAQRRFLDLMGTPVAHKRHAVLEGGHAPADIRGLIREVLDWLDKYIGPVK
jgi:eukaryotic-like serine/threonine-protein kinase